MANRAGALPLPHRRQAFLGPRDVVQHHQLEPLAAQPLQGAIERGRRVRQLACLHLACDEQPLSQAGLREQLAEYAFGSAIG